MTVITTFALGLLLAVIMNDRRMRGQKYYRVLLILPYAMPIFLTAPLWRGMLNTDFGLINQMLPGDPINWLGEANLARFSVLLGQPLDRLPLLLPGLHRCAHRDPRRPEGSGLRGRRQRPARLPHGRAAPAA